MRNYQLGNPELDKRLEGLVRDTVASHEGHTHDEDLVREMIVSVLKMHRDDNDRGDLKIVNSALKELRYSFLVFSRYRETPKVTVYGSARTAPEVRAPDLVLPALRRDRRQRARTRAAGARKPRVPLY